MIGRESLFPYQDPDRDLPIATDDEISQSFRGTIERMVSAVCSPIRISPFLGRKYDLLFFVTYKKYSIVKGHKTGERLAKVEANHGQDILFQVMSEFGFKESTHQQGNPRRSLLEYSLYPSQSIPGLVFCREVSFMQPENRPHSVEWGVEDRAPRWRIRLNELGKLLPRVNSV